MLPNITIGLDDRTYEVLTALAQALTGMKTNGNPASVLMAGAPAPEPAMPAMTAKAAKPVEERPATMLAAEATAPASAPAVAEKLVTLADVRAAITNAVKREASNKAQVLAILNDFGAQNASTLDEEHFVEFCQKVNDL